MPERADSRQLECEHCGRRGIGYEVCDCGYKMVRARSPRRKDHEAGKRAALDAVAELRMHGGPNGGWKDLALGEVVDMAIDAYLSHASPSRDGTVAVEDVAEWLRVRAGRTHGNGASSALYAAARDVLAEFGSARAGESNEGGNQ